MAYVDKNLLIEIDELKDSIEDYDLVGRINRNLVEESNAHSDGLENAYLARTSEANGTSSYIESKRKRQKKTSTFQNLMNAWNWAETNYKGKLDRQFLEDIARRIEPENPEVQLGYRNKGVRITGARVSPPSPEKISKQMEEALAEINDADLHPIERAVLAHFQIVRIHPFFDGNGRTSRLVQNLILYKNGYAPATVRSEEKNVYISLLDRAVWAYKVRTSQDEIQKEPSEDEMAFFNYLASKVNIELNNCLDIFHRLPQYEVLLNDIKDPGLLFAVKRKISSRFEYGKHIGKVRRSQKNRNALIVTGEVTGENITNLIEGLNSKLGQNAVQYKIRRLK